MLRARQSLPCTPWLSCRFTKPKRSNRCTRVVPTRGWCRSCGQRLTSLYERRKSQRGPSGRRCPPWWSRSAIWMTNPGSASLEPGFTQAPVQDADAQAHYQMHPAPGLVCSDRPEGCLLSCFDPSATQTVPTFCVRRSGMEVQGPPLLAPLSPRVFTKVVEGALAPLQEVCIRILNYLDDWLILAL